MYPNEEISKVVFDSDRLNRQTRTFQDQTPKFIQAVINHSGGLIKDENQAQNVMIGFSVIIIVISIFLFINSSSGPKTQELTPQQKAQMGITR